LCGEGKEGEKNMKAIKTKRIVIRMTDDESWHLFREIDSLKHPDMYDNPVDMEPLWKFRKVLGNLG